MHSCEVCHHGMLMVAKSEDCSSLHFRCPICGYETIKTNQNQAKNYKVLNSTLYRRHNSP